MQYKIYIMEAEEFIKIGVTSRSVIQRAKEIQTGCPIPITSIKYVTMPNKGLAFSIEKDIHNEFEDYLSHGEWFVRFNKYTTKISKVARVDASDFKEVAFKDFIGTATREKLERIIEKRIRRLRTEKISIQNNMNKQELIDHNMIPSKYFNGISDKERQRKIEKAIKNNPHAFKDGSHE